MVDITKDKSVIDTINGILNNKGVVEIRIQRDDIVVVSVNKNVKIRVPKE